MAYKALKGGPMVASSLRHIWRLKAPPRMVIFGWLAIRNRILTHDNLKKKGCIIVSRCTLCKTAVESVYHLFHTCTYTIQVYRRITWGKPSPNWPASPVLNVTDKCQVGLLSEAQRALLLIMNFIIWRERCNRSFTDASKDPWELAEEIWWQEKFFR